MNDIYQMITSNVRTIGAVAAIILVGSMFYLLARRGLGILRNSGVADPVVRMLRLFLRWFFAALVSLLVLQQLGVLENVWSALVAIMAMVAVGFIAVWSILSNILSTLLILIYKPFRIGDDIDIPSDALSGIVEDLNLMFTTLKAEDGRLIQIPNNQFFQKPIRRKRGNADIDLFEQFIRHSD